MSRPLLLDLFCGAGGAAMGYHLAGFDVVGVDINPQPNYPFEFHQGDALSTAMLTWLNWHRFDAIHASPPCQAYSAMSNCRPGLADQYPDLVPSTRTLLQGRGVPWVIENVVGSPVLGADNLAGRYGLTLCGSMFGLRLYRHRVFESSWPLSPPRECWHNTPASRAGHWKPGTIISVSGNCSPIAEAKAAMEIHWMNRAELAEAIPPAYTAWIGGLLLDHLSVAA